MDYEDERIAFADWATLKPKTPYGQLPLLTLTTENGKEHVYTQSVAMVRYVARQFAPDTLYPVDQFWDMEQVLGVLDDARKSLDPALYLALRPERFGYEPGFQKTEQGQALIQSMRTHWMTTDFPKYMGHLQDWLDRHDGKWLASDGDMPTIVDCMVVPFLRFLTKGTMDHIPPNALTEQFPQLALYVQRFCALPQIQGKYTDGVH